MKLVKKRTIGQSPSSPARAKLQLHQKLLNIANNSSTASLIKRKEKKTNRNSSKQQPVKTLDMMGSLMSSRESLGPSNINLGPSTFLSDRKKIAFSPLAGEYSKATLPPSDNILQSRADLEIEHHLKRGAPISAA